jgi:hypothetical protein
LRLRFGLVRHGHGPVNGFRLRLGFDRSLRDDRDFFHRGFGLGSRSGFLPDANWSLLDHLDRGDIVSRDFLDYRLSLDGDFLTARSVASISARSSSIFA